MDFINGPILLFSLFVGVSILTSLFSGRLGIPLILLFLCLGLIAGSSNFEVMTAVKQPHSAFFVGSVALALILFDSGFHTQLKGYRTILAPAALLASIGVLMTAAILTPVACFVLNIHGTEAFLLCSIISSTDAAAVFFLLRSKGLHLRTKIKATLEAESGSNDPMAIFLTLILIHLLQTQPPLSTDTITQLLTVFFKQSLLGAAMGVLCGWLIKTTVNALRLEVALFPILILSIALVCFAVTNSVGGSGFLAVYIAGLIAGNGPIQAHMQISKFQETLTWFSQITLFLTLGAFVSLSDLTQEIIPGLILGAGLIFIARPLAVSLILLCFKKYSRPEIIFISAVGLRGATSILLALAPVVAGLPYANRFINIVFIMVLLSLTMQGLAIPFLARHYRLTHMIHHA